MSTLEYTYINTSTNGFLTKLQTTLDVACVLYLIAHILAVHLTRSVHVKELGEGKNVIRNHCF